MMRLTPKYNLLIGATVCVACAGCLNTYEPVANRNSLYTRTGGAPAIRQIAEALVMNGTDNPESGFRCRSATDSRTATAEPTTQPATAITQNQSQLIMRYANLLGALSGGPEVYEGRSMPAAHEHAVARAQFEQFITHVRNTMKAMNLEDSLIEEWIGRLMNLKYDIVDAGEG